MESIGLSASAAAAEDRAASPRPTEDLREVARDVARFTLHHTDTSRTDRLWPPDPLMFSTNPLNIAYGACGTALFIHDVTGQLPPEAHEWLVRRSAAAAGLTPGLYLGFAGVAYTLAELGHEGPARETMAKAYASPLLYNDPSMLLGVAGWGLASLELFRRLADGEYLERAADAGEHLLRTAQRENEGLFWTDGQDRTRVGFGYGSSGITVFLLQLHAATGDARFAEAARGAMEFDIGHGTERDDQIRWGADPVDPGTSPYWVEGTSGVGTALIRMHSALGDARYLDLARRAARGSRTFLAAGPHLFRGMSAIGEFMLDMFLATGEQEYLVEAERMAERTLMFRIPRPEGTAFPGRYLTRISTDWAFGSAGIGLFLNRLATRGARRLHDVDTPLSVGAGSAVPAAEHAVAA